MMTRLLFFLTMIISIPSFACRESIDSTWTKQEAVLVNISDKLNIVEVKEVVTKLNKTTYKLQVVSSLKGPDEPGKDITLGPFPVEEKTNKSYGALIWKTKNCRISVKLEAGKRYILFSEINNPKSVQIYSQDNEDRLKALVVPTHK